MALFPRARRLSPLPLALAGTALCILCPAPPARRPGRRYVVRLRARDEAGNASRISAPLWVRVPGRK
jgi:hypothetical protein